jgi:hypothetical protein
VVLILAHNALVNVGIYNADSEFVEAIKGKPWEASTISSIRAGVGNLWSLAQIGSKTLLALLFLSNPGVEFDGTFLMNINCITFKTERDDKKYFTKVAK